MFAQDADNSKVWILGPKKLIRPNITVVSNIPIWDPKRKHVPLLQIKIPRPPNAYILYRKDKHNGVKAENPNLHNNKICKSFCHSFQSYLLTLFSGHHGRNVEAGVSRGSGQVSPEVSGNQGSPAGASPRVPLYAS